MGSRGRIGYIDDMTLMDSDTVPELAFSSIRLTLTSDADATDDPLRGQAAIKTLKAGEEVTLLALLEPWAYVETTMESRPCRLFIPFDALKP